MSDQISNFKIYTEEMSKPIKDKLFFLDHINDYDQIVDYGCADGFLLKEIEKLNLNKILAGYDISSKMIELARLDKRQIFFTEFWNNICTDKDTLILLSSVIHEVYSYGSKFSINQFYKNVFKSEAKYIVVRDMFLTKETSKRLVNKSDLQKIKSKTYDIYSSFKYYNSDIVTQRDLLQFLLKYRYQENWEREVKENYFPISFEDFLKRVPKKWELIHSKQIRVPFIVNKVKEDFDIDIEDTTHAELIFRRKV